MTGEIKAMDNHTVGETKEQNDGTGRFCRKCLTRDMLGQEEYFSNLRDYINNLDPDIKASEALYEERLAVCMECDLLFQGMCRTCGCYVELRAAIDRNSCPNKRW